MNLTIRTEREKVCALQRAISGLPQVELPTEHLFADGMYARILPRPAGTLIVGKIHKKEHFYLVTKGRVRVTTDDGVKELSAPAVLVSSPGTKRAVYALEDSVCMTVHRVESHDLDEIEAELIEPESVALFDAHNKLKELS